MRFNLEQQLSSRANQFAVQVSFSYFEKIQVINTPKKERLIRVDIENHSCQHFVLV